jgi:hypothetical protein
MPSSSSEENTMIDGLKLTFAGKELRKRLDERVDSHMQAAERWHHEQERGPDDQTEDAPLLPEEMCAHEAQRHEWRAAVLEYVRDHIDPAETYHLDADDVEFGELLPPRPGGVEQQEYEERTAVGFNLERLVKEIGRLSSRLELAVERSRASVDAPLRSPRRRATGRSRQRTRHTS